MNIGNCEFLGRELHINKQEDGFYQAINDGRKTQEYMTAEECIRYLLHCMNNASPSLTRIYRTVFGDAVYNPE